MKTVIKFLAVFFITTTALAYEVNIFNNTKGKMVVTIDVIGRPSNYTRELNPGQRWSESTGLYCIRGIKASGRSGTVQGVFNEEQVPSIACKNYNLTIDEENYYRYEDPLSGNVEVRAKNLAFRWGLS